MKNPRFLTMSVGMMDSVPIFMLMVETLASCCLVLKIINSVLSSLHFNMLRAMQDLISPMLSSSLVTQANCNPVVPGLNAIYPC